MTAQRNHPQAHGSRSATPCLGLLVLAGSTRDRRRGGNSTESDDARRTARPAYSRHAKPVLEIHGKTVLCNHVRSMIDSADGHSIIASLLRMPSFLRCRAPSVPSCPTFSAPRSFLPNRVLIMTPYSDKEWRQRRTVRPAIFILHSTSSRFCLHVVNTVPRPSCPLPSS
jgi:hypothetical protein